MSRFGLYAFGYYLLLSAYFVSDAIMMASKLGTYSFPIPINIYTVFIPGAMLILLELLTVYLSGERE